MVSYYSKIEDIIFNNIYQERNITDWKQYKDNVINNFNNINFIESIENFTFLVKGNCILLNQK